MLVLISHGSRDPRWRGSLKDLTAAVQAGSSSEEVKLAFMQFDGPTLSEVVEEAVGRGEHRFRLHPLFMASAGHVDKDIRPMVEELGNRFPDVRMELLEPVG